MRHILYLILVIIALSGCVVPGDAAPDIPEEIPEPEPVQEPETPNEEVPEEDFEEEYQEDFSIYDPDTLIVLAEEREDASLCQHIPDNETHFSKDFCLVRVAARTNGSELCEEISNKTFYDTCYWGVALQSRTPSLCNKLVDPDPMHDADLCRKVAAVTTPYHDTDDDNHIGDDLEVRGMLVVEFETSPEQDQMLIDGYREIAKSQLTYSPEYLNEWVQFYYLDPKPDEVVDIIKALSKDGWFENEEITKAMKFFFGPIFFENRFKMKGWVKELDDINEDHDPIIWEIIWLSDCAIGRELLEKISEEEKSFTRKEILFPMLYYQPTNVQVMEVNHPIIIDFLWGGFYATGDKKYLLKIIEPLAGYASVQVSVEKLLDQIDSGVDVELTDSQKAKLPRYYTGLAARESLTPNAATHELVMDVCVEQEPRSSSGRVLRKIIADVKEGNYEEYNIFEISYDE